MILPSLPRSSIRVFITFLLLGEFGAASVTLSFLFTSISGTPPAILSEEEIPLFLPLLRTEESSLGDRLDSLLDDFSSLTFGLSCFCWSEFKLILSGTKGLGLCFETIHDFPFGGSGDAKLTASSNSSSSSEKSKTTLLFLPPSPLEALLKLAS